MTSERVLGQASYLVTDAGLPRDPALLDAASEYVQRTWRGRRFGIIGGLVLGGTHPAAAGQAVLALPLIPAGYLLGVLLSELVVPRRSASAIRSAGLRPRRARDLVPRWMRASYWFLLVPVVAAPLLALIHRAPGATHVATPTYTCSVAGFNWPAPRTFAIVGLLGAAGLVLTELTLVALSRRARPTNNPAMTRLDDILRRLSAQSVAAGAAALGMTMIATICDVIAQAGHDVLCPGVPASGLGPAAYPWAVAVAPWIGWVGLACVMGALLIVATAGWRTSPQRVLARGGIA